MEKIKTSKFKVGDIVFGRLICEVIPCSDYGGKPSFRYGYRYPHEPEDIELIYCAESTLVRKIYE